MDTSLRLVAAMISRPSFASKGRPFQQAAASMSCSRSSLPPISPHHGPAPRPSISSMNTIHEFSWLFEHVAHTEAPTTGRNISTKSNRDGEERHTRLTRIRACQQCCYRRRALKQGTLGSCRPNGLNFLRVVAGIQRSLPSLLLLRRAATSSKHAAMAFSVKHLALNFTKPIAPPLAPPCMRS